MTQLFSRLLASDFPHPPGPIGDFKVSKGQRLRAVPWEAEPLPFTHGRAPSSDLRGFELLSVSRRVRCRDVTEFDTRGDRGPQ